MKKLLSLIALFGVLATGCEELFPNEQKPVDKPTEYPTEDQIFFTDAEGNYVVSADGGEVLVIIATNLEYSIVIQEEAQSWLSVAETRAEERIDKRTFIIARNDSFEERSTIAELIGTDGKVLQSITFAQSGQTKVFETDSEGNYRVVANGGEVMVTVTTNLEYNIVISEDAEEWLSVADSRALRVDTLTFIVAPNDTAVERTTTVKFVDDSNNILQTISFTQNVAGQSGTVCPNNEIWYTNDSTTKASAPNDENVFGANIVSNTYDIGKECWVIKFDGEVTTIGEGAFAECSSLTSVTIPESVTTIGYAAFFMCSSLTYVTIGDSVTTIGELAFDSCSSLTSVTIPDSVTTIGNSTFQSCSSLTSITIPDNVTTIGNYAFRQCSSLTNVTIGDSVTTIGDAAFAVCSSLTSVTIPDSVTMIGDYAFENCDSLTSVTIPDSVTAIGYMAFRCCRSLTSVTIGDSVTMIGDYAFENCDSLTSVTIPDSVTTIGKSAFYSCSLTSVTIGDSVTTIGYWAFAYCESLTSITIPDSVTTIGYAAFSSCCSLTSVYCKPTIPPVVLYDYIHWEAFYSNASGRKIYVPMESVEAYKSASGWSDYASDIEGYNF